MGNITHGLHCTLTEAAAAIGVTQSRAQQIERSALRKCRAYLESKGIALADLFEDVSPLQQIDTSCAELRVDASADQEVIAC